MLTQNDDAEANLPGLRSPSLVQVTKNPKTKPHYLGVLWGIEVWQTYAGHGVPAHPAYARPSHGPVRLPDWTVSVPTLEAKNIK